MKNPEPVRKLKVPKELKQYDNGKLPPHLLKDIQGGGQLWTKAADWWNLMFEAAKADGITLKAVARGYRPYEAQAAMFLLRYDDKPTGRVPKVTRKWHGKTWFLRKGKSPSATPGTSNHGWGLAQDIEVPADTYKWMCHNAPKFGFYLQGKSKTLTGKPNPEFEAWHWQFCRTK
jgi:D-alanyl-D-alanine carboxypeptidase